MTYTDKYGAFFGRLTDDGNVAVLHVEDGEPATRLDQNAYPVGSDLSTRHEQPEGIVLPLQMARALGIEIET